MNPYLYPYDENGHIKQVLKIGDGEEYALNPLYNASLGTKFETTYQNFIDNFSVEWDVLEGLKLKAAVSLNKKMTVEDRFLPAGHNSFYEKDLKGSYEKKVTDDFSYDANVMAAYTKEVNRHLFNATFVWNIKETKNDLFTTTAYNFPNDKMDHIGMGVEYQDGDKPSGDYEVSRLMGVVGNFNYGYDNRYLVDFSVRSDGSSVYGSSKRWGTFGSVGVAWNLHHEKWLAENPYVNELKIRGSWGTTGGQNFYPFQAMMMYSYKESAIDGLTYDDYIGALLKAFGNPDLKWQQTEKLNVGVDFTLLNSRLSGYFNIYKDVSKSVLIDVLLAPSVGFASYKDNLGEIENKGLELNLRGVLLKDADRRMQWDVFFNIVKNKNRLMKLNDALAAYNKSQDDEMNGEIEEGKTRAPMVRYQEGKSINMIWANESIGIDPNTGEEVFIALNGDKVNKWSTDNYKPLGCSDPKFEGNFGTMFMYKGWELNAHLYYKYGGYIYNQTLVDKVENVNPNENGDRRILYDRWNEPGDVAKFKKVSDVSVTNPTSRFVEKENYIQNVNMNYVTINKDYKIKVDYVMVDDINLYIVFSLCSAKSMNENYRMAVNYLDIKDENQNVIYSYTDENEVKTVKGSKKINCTDNKEKKELVFIYSKEHPKMKQLNVSFNRIILYDEKNPEKNVIRIDCDCNFKIDIAEKFVNRENIEFYNFENTDDIEIKKCIVNDTGMYIILNAKEYINRKQIYIGEKSYEGTEIIIDSNDKQDECILQFDITKNELDKNKSIRLEINDKILKIEE